MCIFFSSPRSFFILRSILIDLHRPSSPSLFFFSNRFVREFHFDLREFTLRYPSKNFCRKYFTTPFQPSKWITNAERANSNVFRDVWSIPKLTFILHPPFYGWQKSLWKQFDSREYLLFLRSFSLDYSAENNRSTNFSFLENPSWIGVFFFIWRSGGGAHQMSRVSISSKSSQ